MVVLSGKRGAGFLLKTGSGMKSSRVLRAGCLSALFYFANANALELPEWFLAPPQKNELYWYGVGVGETQTRARDAALSDISNQIESQISVSTNTTYQKRESEVSQAFNKTIHSESQRLTFSDVDVQDQALIEGKSYLLLRVSREEFISEQSRLLQNEIESSQQSLTNAAKARGFNRLNYLGAFRPHHNRAEALNNVLIELSPAFGSVQQQLHAMAQEYADLLDTVSISVTALPSASKLLAPIAEKLNQLDLSYREAAPHQLLLVINAKEKRGRSQAQFISQLETHFQIKDMAAPQVSLADVRRVYRGSSKQDIDSAQQQAINEAIQDIQGSPLSALLGL